MTLSALGIFSAAGAGGVPAVSAYELIETQILGSNQASITFSNLGNFSSTYRHLQIRVSGRATGTGISYLTGRFNNVSTTTYDAHGLSGNGTSVSSFAAINRTDFYVCRHDPQANNFNAGIVDILDPYSTTKNKTVRTLTGGPGTSPSEIYLFSGLWRNTASITSITILVDGSASNLATGSRFSLYGIRG